MNCSVVALHFTALIRVLFLYPSRVCQCVYSIQLSHFPLSPPLSYIISGASETKPLQELLPSIVSQLGMDNLSQLKNLAEQAGGAAGAPQMLDDDDDDVS